MTERRITWVGCRGADSADGWSWLEPPASMGAVTVIDVASATRDDAHVLVRRWTESAWAAWDRHHDAVRGRATSW